MKLIAVFCVGAALAGAAILAPIQDQAKEVKVDQVVLEVTIDKSYDDVVKAIEAAIKRNNLLIIGEPNYKAMQRMVGKTIRGAKAYFLFRPDLGTPIFANDYNAAMEIPLKILIYEPEEGKTVVRWKKPTSCFDDYSKELNELGKKLDALLEDIVDAARK